MIKNLNLTKTFIASLILSAVIGTTSCSHQQETKEGWEGIRDGAAAEATPSDSKASSDDSSASSNDVAATEEKKEEKKDEVAPKEDLTATIEKKDDAAAPSEAPASDAPKTDVTSLDAPKADESKAPSESLAPVASTSPEVSPDASKPADTVAATESVAPSMSPSSDAAAPSTINMDNKSLEASTAAPAPTEPTLTNPTSGEEEAKAENESSDKPAAVKAEAKPVVSHVPTVPSAPLAKAGKSLNRYYFIRKGDTPAAVGQKVGAEAKSFHVMKGWKVGHFVMYPSTQNPSDANVIAHHAEAGMAATSYKVKAGDSLSSIAKEAYGDFRSWTEVAVDNHISNPDRIAVGATLSLFPTDGQPVAQATAADQDSQDDAVTDADTQASTETWKPDSKVAAVAAPAAQSPAPVTQAKFTAQSPAMPGQDAMVDNGKLLPAATPGDKVAREPIAEMASPVGDLPVPGKVTAKVDKQKSSLASMEVVQFVQRNLFMVFMALGAMGFLIYAALLKARRARADSDF